MKKFIKVTGIIIVALLILLVSLPIVFKGKIAGIAQEMANNSINAKLSFKDASLSFIRNFPNITASLSDIAVEGIDSFDGDTLFYAEKVSVVLNLKEVISGKEISIRKISVISPEVLAKVLEDGKANWDITKTDPAQETSGSGSDDSSFAISLESIDIKKANIVYDDRKEQMYAQIKDWNGSFSIKYSADKAIISTDSEIAGLTYIMGKLPVLNNMAIKADINMEADLKENKYTFKENVLSLNALEASINGWVQMPDTSRIDMDLELNTEKATLKEILSFIPAIYMTDFASIETSGNLLLQATVKGSMQGDNYPAFNVLLSIDNGMFRYPDLPKAVTDIRINSKISSTGGSLDNTKVDISAFHFNIGGNPFDATASVTHPMSDPDFSGKIKGKLNLNMISEVYPLPDSISLKGEINADMSISGRMSHIEKEQYEQVNASGNLSLSGFTFKSPDLPDEVVIKDAGMSFNPKEVVLSSFSMLIGKNDVSASGRINNPLPYFLANGDLKGSLNVSSNYLNLNDFMQEIETEETTVAETESVTAFPIPEQFDLNLVAKAQEVLFDNLVLKNIEGSLKVKDGRVTMNNLSAHSLGGVIIVNGHYEAPENKKPNMAFGLDLQKVSFSETYAALDMVKSLAPIFQNLEGNYSMKVNVNSELSQDLTPIITSLTGDGGLKANNLRLSNMPVLNALASALKDDGLREITTKDLNIPFTIDQGRVHTLPFDMDLKDVKMNFSGSTGIDQSIDYIVKVNLPERLAKQGIKSLSGNIGGTFTSPKVSLDFADIAKQAITGKLNDLFGKTVTDSTGNQVNLSVKENLALQAEQMRTKAKEAGENLIKEAEKQGNKLVDEAKTPIAKTAAKVAAKKLVTEAGKQAEKLNAEAEQKINALLEGENPE